MVIHPELQNNIAATQPNGQEISSTRDCNGPLRTLQVHTEAIGMSRSLASWITLLDTGFLPSLLKHEDLKKRFLISLLVAKSHMFMLWSLCVLKAPKTSLLGIPPSMMCSSEDGQIFYTSVPRVCLPLVKSAVCWKNNSMIKPLEWMPNWKFFSSTGYICMPSMQTGHACGNFKANPLRNKKYCLSAQTG